MSGKDERKSAGIPVCPICEKTPVYWILKESQNLISTMGYLLGDEYLKDARQYSKHVLFSVEARTLDIPDFLQRLQHVSCFENSTHVFGKDSAVFHNVKAMIIRYNDEEGYQINR